MENRSFDSKSLIEGFISSRVRGRGLDRRTERAYRLDLEHFYTWAEQRRSDCQISEESPMLEAETGGRQMGRLDGGLSGLSL